MKTNFEHKQIVLKKWEELIDELSLFLDTAKKSGGTLSHKVGSMKDKQKELLNNFKNYV
tara:strand:- start:54 stop:230 length:177 start_codon:yes stop_codon:yes gene_type:complete